ncbi:MAG: hypothetical protein EOO04_32825, partial [Chitinophagaceae bacterium]
MATTVKIFVSGEEQATVQQQVQVIEKYDNFLLAQVSPSELKKIKDAFLVEDITPQYRIDIGLNNIDTNKPRVGSHGLAKPHPAYSGAAEKQLNAGKHHYLVQFIGPVKKTWLGKLKKAGAELRAPYADFTYVVRCTDKIIRLIAAIPVVRWTGHLPYEARIETVLQAKTKGTVARGLKPLPRTRLLAGIYTIEFFGEADTIKA